MKQLTCVLAQLLTKQTTLQSEVGGTNSVYTVEPPLIRTPLGPK